MLDERVLAVLARLEEEDAAEREAGLPAVQRSRQVAPTTGRFLFALAASQAGIEVLEIGGSRGYSSIWLAAGARVLGGRARLARARPGQVRGVAQRTSPTPVSRSGRSSSRATRTRRSRRREDTFDLVFLDAEKDDYETLFALARPLLEPGGLVVADNVLSHAETLGAYSAARQADPTLSSVTVPLDRGLELSVVLAAT